MIEEDAVVGMTSNPTIFEKAIGGSSDYDEALRTLLDGNNKSDEEIMLSLIVEDIQMAADVLKPVYDQTKHKDGYVSIEVLPRVANDTAATITMAHDLWERVRRPNIFVKIPATDEGLPAIEQCIADGVNINITLMFSVKVYEDVARAFIRGLQRRMKDGHPIDVASVASFFVSRVDTAVDKLLEQKIAAATDPAERARLQKLMGKAAVANAKMAYQAFLRIFNGPEFGHIRRTRRRCQAVRRFDRQAARGDCEQEAEAPAGIGWRPRGAAGGTRWRRQHAARAAGADRGGAPDRRERCRFVEVQRQHANRDPRAAGVAPGRRSDGGTRARAGGAPQGAGRRGV